MPISLFATLAAAAMVTAAPAPAARHDLETLLAKPVSPGVIALLLPHTGDTRAAARVTEALAHEDAAVRAAAARVAGVAPLLSAGLAVRRALDSETDRSAAAEQLRASVLLLSAGDDLSLVLAARTHGLVDLLAETVANARGPLALPLLDPLVEAGLQEHREAVFIASATYGGRERLNVIGAAALRTKDTSRWSAVLSLARQPGADFAPGLLLAALGSQDSSIRAAVVLAPRADRREGDATVTRARGRRRRDGGSRFAGVRGRRCGVRPYRSPARPAGHGVRGRLGHACGERHGEGSLRPVGPAGEDRPLPHQGRGHHPEPSSHPR